MISNEEKSSDFPHSSSSPTKLDHCDLELRFSTNKNTYMNKRKIENIEKKKTPFRKIGGKKAKVQSIK